MAASLFLTVNYDEFPVKWMISIAVDSRTVFEKRKVSHITLVDIFQHVHYNKHKKNTLGIPSGIIQHMNEAQSGCVHEQVAKADCECPPDYGF